MSTWSLFLWLLNYWPILIWVGLILVAYVYAGKYAAFGVLTLGIGLFAYNKGKSEQSVHAKEVEEERENEYKKIEARGTTRDDVTKRLRDGDY